MEILIKFYDHDKNLRELTLSSVVDYEQELNEMLGDEEYHLDLEVDGVKIIGDNELEDFNVDVDKLFASETTIEEYASKLEEINEMIEGIDDLDDVKAVMNVSVNDFLEALETVYNERCIIYRNVYSEEDFAREYAEDLGSLCGVEIPRDSSLWWYIDWERVAKDMFMDLNYDSETNRVIDFIY